MKIYRSLAIIVNTLLMTVATSGAEAATPAPIVVCYPGGPVNEADASAGMEAMLRVLERVGQWPAHSFTPIFTSKAAECRKLFADKKPGFAITSLGLFLELRAKNSLVPLVQPQIKGSTSEKYQLISRNGSFSDIAALKGKTLGGTVLEEPDFIGRIVFEGKIDPATYFNLQPSRQAIRALRSLDSGELDAVIVNGQQSSGLSSLKLNNPTHIVFTSADIPLMGMVANQKTTSPTDRSRFIKSLEAMCADQEGRKLCDLFGVETFIPANPKVFEGVITLWDTK